MESSNEKTEKCLLDKQKSSEENNELGMEKKLNSDKH